MLCTFCDAHAENLYTHDCHCVHVMGKRIAVGICCGRMIGESTLAEEDAHDVYYWLIKCEAGYWLEEGGCTSKQGKAQRFRNKKEARKAKAFFCLDDIERKNTWLVRIIPPKAVREKCACPVRNQLRSV